MKKILFFIAITSFCSLGMTSCSEDDPVIEKPDPNPNPNIDSQLAVKANKTKAVVKTPVKFTATASGTAVADAVFYVDGEAIKGDTYTKQTIGTIKVHARRPGHLDSEAISVEYYQP